MKIIITKEQFIKLQECDGCMTTMNSGNYAYEAPFGTGKQISQTNKKNKKKSKSKGRPRRPDFPFGEVEFDKDSPNIKKQ